MSGSGAIVLYHRVTATRHDPFGLCVDPALFARHLEYFASQCQVLPLDELVDCLKRNAVPDRSVTLTFDDGYLDNLTVAAPLLEDRRLPATFFLTTDHLDHPRAYWWDSLAAILLDADALPASVSLVRPAHPDRIVDISGDRLVALRQVHALLRQLGELEREKAMVAISEQCGTATLPNSDRPMAVEEIRALSRSPRHLIGAHTTHHLSLPAHPPDLQSLELSESKRTLEHVTGVAIRSVAYPFGAQTSVTRQLADRAGFTVGVTTERRAASIEDEPLGLPRIEITNRATLEDLAMALSSR